MSADCALLVIGGGPAGLAAARSYRESGGEGTVRIISSDSYPPYHRPPLSKDYLRGESEASDLPLEEESFYAEHDIDLVLQRTAVGLDAERHVVTLDGGEEVSYDACVLATGSDPFVPPIGGSDSADVYYLRHRDDADRLRAAAEGASTAIVVGSGFIGCEAAVSLAEQGLQVTMISGEALPQVGRLGPEVGGRIAAVLREAGVTLLGGQSVDAIDGGRAVVVDEATYPADLVLVATGAKPVVDLAADGGAELEGGRVVVDERMATSLDDVYAVGDIALAHNAAAGRRLAVEHWGDALVMGEVAGANAAGGERSWDEVPGFFSDIGDFALQYAAWGDGYDEVHLVEHSQGAFTAWYTRNEVVVGVLTHDRDDDYEHGRELVAQGAPLPPEDNEDTDAASTDDDSPTGS